MEHAVEGFTAEPVRFVLARAATDQDGRPGRTSGQAEGSDPDDPQEEEQGQPQVTDSQATPDQAEGEDEDA